MDYFIRFESESRSAVFPQLRANLVRYHATGRRADQDPVVGSLARTHSGPRSAVQFAGIRQRLPVPRWLTNEPATQMLRLVNVPHCHLPTLSRTIRSISVCVCVCVCECVCV